MFATGASGWAFQRRASNDGWSSHSSGPSGTSPGWVRLVRAGDEISAYYSTDGSSWSLVDSDSISLPATVYVGLAVTSHNNDTSATARFTGVAAQGYTGHAPLPSGWTNRDVGGPAVAGTASLTNGTFSVTAGGADIWNQADQFQFVYRVMEGDAEIIARVASVSASDPWAKAGVMIRGSLASGSPHASMFATGASGWAFQRRASNDGWSSHSSGPSGTSPGWVRLVRTGDQISAYYSTDGSSWSLVDSDSISLPGTFYVGLAVTSHNDSASATARFTGVSVTTPTPGANQPPTVSLMSPSDGSSFPASAAITVRASASDPDGVASVEFRVGSQVIGTDAASPYSATWSNVPAGTYTLTAMARDTLGATRTSAGVTITVTGSSTPTWVVFEPSSDHENVTSYSVEIRQAGTPISAPPVAARDLGRPPVVNGEISVDISTLVDPLPAGTYYAVASATGPGGTSQSNPSGTFSK
jgi:regulation of enolase protein 1 (concanavalin A-like superfamily)